ncbi:hypothetical protein D1J51_01020 [Leucobacter sp. wl10]|nr:hypothetical protein D1J51_01020 [Leucobacter sp. wl10]
MVLAGRSVRTIGVVAIVSTALPLGFAGCNSTPSADVQAAELRAAVDSDLLEMPVVRVYDVSDTQLLSPVDSPTLRSLIDDRVSTSGYIVLEDGVITEAQYEVRAEGLPDAQFVLSEPTVLRRQDSEVDTVTATGSLSVDGSVRGTTNVRLTPTLLNEDTAEFDVTMSVPDNPLIAGTELPLDEISAHLVFAAR